MVRHNLPKSSPRDEDGVGVVVVEEEEGGAPRAASCNDDDAALLFEGRGGVGVLILLINRECISRDFCFCCVVAIDSMV